MSCEYSVAPTQVAYSKLRLCIITLEHSFVWQIIFWLRMSKITTHLFDIICWRTIILCFVVLHNALHSSSVFKRDWKSVFTFIYTADCPYKKRLLLIISAEWNCMYMKMNSKNPKNVTYFKTDIVFLNLDIDVICISMRQPYFLILPPSQS